MTANDVYTPSEKTRMTHFLNKNWLSNLLAIVVAISLLATNQLFAQNDTTNVGTRISGTILLPDDKPAVGTKVYLLKVEKDSYTLPTHPQVAASDGSGKYVFDAVTAGAYRIWGETSELTSLEDKLKGKEVKIEQDSPENVVNLSLHKGCNYDVKVCGKEDGSPVPNATISFGWTDIERSYTTNELGESKIAGLGRDEWYFVVKADGFATTYRRVPKQPLGATTELEFRLAPGCDLEGRVVNEQGEAIAGAKVNASEVSASMTPGFGNVLSDKDGRFLLKSLPRGDSVRLSASKESHNRYRSEINLPQDEKTFKHDITLKKMSHGGDCIVTVMDESGEPIPNATVENMGSSSVDVRNGTTGVDGTVRLANLFSASRGKQATIRAKGYIAQRIDLTPGPPDQPGEVTAKMIQGEQIRGRLLKPNGEPASGVRVYYNQGERGANNLGGRVDTDRDGRFFIDGLPNPCTFTFYTGPPFAPIQDRNLPVGKDEDVDIQMEMETVIRLRAIDAVTKKPIPEFNVKIGFPKNGLGPQGISSSLTNPGTEILGETKEFRIGQLSSGNFLNCTVAAKGFVRTVVENVEAVVEDGCKTLDVELAPEGASMFSVVAGKLLDSKQQPVRAALVRLLVLDPKFPKNISQNWRLIETEQIARESCCMQFLKTTTAADGSFKFDKVQGDGFIVLACSGPGIANKFFPLPETHQATDLVGLELKVESCGKLRIKVDKDVYPEAHSVLVQPKTQGILLGYTSRNIPPNETEVTFESLPPGLYEVVLRSKPNETGNGTFTQARIASVLIEIVAEQETEQQFQ